MFTGIITGQGHILDIHDAGDRHLTIGCDWDCASIDIGASIACSGICLTVVARDAHSFKVEASSETISVSTLGDWQKGDKINLERALRMGDELGGHIVSGHVDGLAEVLSITPDGDSHIVSLSVPADLAMFVAPKGSVTLDGVSLTVNNVTDDSFTINVIAHTWDVTQFGVLTVGQKMNMEIDMLARYVARLNSLNKEA
ncbi:riboflavin synthase [Candidatus Puniceispirillum marinum]|uniref:Riboflavin synthase n=1 Tax=Puniceispirillum marinum (strain IMCC1322) TaxID=488538 RepID=D5BPC5_PUNMI|nr:riboflavin synthase [Candidatus Puniceispirillum marinum]ADE38407.1 Lumazine-binding protein [Candidatus Puniceispirillum marinum IMCC1322]